SALSWLDLTSVFQPACNSAPSSTAAMTGIESVICRFIGTWAAPLGKRVPHRPFETQPERQAIAHETLGHEHHGKVFAGGNEPMRAAQPAPVHLAPDTGPIRRIRIHGDGANATVAVPRQPGLADPHAGRQLVFRGERHRPI